MPAYQVTPRPARVLPTSILAAIFLAAAAAEAAVDVIEVMGKTRHEGLFQQYDSSRFIFKTRDDKLLRQMRTSVTSLELDPPPSVSVELKGGKDSPTGLRLKSYSSGTFTFDQNGRPFTVPETRVASIQVWESVRMLDPEQPAPSAAAADPGSEPLESRFKRGAVNIIHFHKADVVSSVRQGNYLQEVAAKSRGRVNVIRVEVTGWIAPIAVEYGITSAPQFWFYGRSGRLSDKLVDRFTDQDIDRALEKAARF